MIDPITQYILNEARKPDVLYHAASELTKILKPRKSAIGHMDKMKSDFGSKEWERNAVFAGTTKMMVYPFGLERINMLWPGNQTEKEAYGLTKGCYLSAKENGKKVALRVHYYNHIPRKPLYLYTVDAKDFTLIKDKPGAAVEQWYSSKVITPLKVDKIFPREIRNSWRIIGKKDWQIKLQKYKVRGYFK